MPAPNEVVDGVEKTPASVVLEGSGALVAPFAAPKKLKAPFVCAACVGCAGGNELLVFAPQGLDCDAAGAVEKPEKEKEPLFGPEEGVGCPLLKMPVVL